MSTSKTDERQRKERQKRLRKGLLAFLKRLRKACESYESLGDWNDLIQPLESMLDEYAQDLPQGRAQRLRQAMNLKAATAEGIQAGCQVLQKEIEGVVGLLPAGGILGSAVIGAFIVVAVGVAAAVVVFNSTTRPLLVKPPVSALLLWNTRLRLFRVVKPKLPKNSLVLAPSARPISAPLAPSISRT